jgi:hypothetical protein
MQRLRAIFAAALSVRLASAPLMGAPSATVWGQWLRPSALMGTVATAGRAHGDSGYGRARSRGRWRCVRWHHGVRRRPPEHSGPRQRANSRRCSKTAAAEREQRDGK